MIAAFSATMSTMNTATPREVGVQRVPATAGFCWMCGRRAVSGERLPGRRHRVRLLCRQHDQAVFGPPGEAPTS
ncbi:hypothetical protein CF165_46685 [Amycolatopsis vastitatis]|uniref:Uncharacterized protein n=1 Tax=Amycolatopsis vastitatis TaxID=1905142 RepID=A0A229SLQ1_9PSEU|nr:hypothetical protein CF165_46685 [Amycolatopsis vastitatis]